MPTEKEIRERAMDEFRMALEVCDIRRNGILEARTEALDAIPAGRAALQVYSDAARAADAALAGEQEQIPVDGQAAEIAAHTKHNDANIAVMATLQEENDKAHQDCQAAVDEAERVYSEAYNEASHMVGTAADQARKAARAARQKDLNAAERARTKALAAADTKYQKALVKNNETMIAEVAAAQTAGVAARAAAEARRDKALRAASTALAKALAGDTACAAVEKDFQGRLRAAAQQCEEEKAAVWQRMNRDLAELGGGVPV
jgi:colicin import membrane protein